MRARGSIGDSWWSRRFIEPLEHSADKGRLSRGRTYARRGAVKKLDITPGRVTAQVAGSQPRPYKVTIGFGAIGDALWDDISAALAQEVLFRAALLAGELPPEIEDVFDELGARMFPASLSDLDIVCSCPDWGYPCKHAAAALYALADGFDRDPFLLPTWLGRDRESLLESIRAHAEGGGAGGGSDCETGERFSQSGSGLAVRARPLSECVGDFWTAEDPVPVPAFSRTLDPVSHADIDIPGLVAALTPMYELMASTGSVASPCDLDAP